MVGAPLPRGPRSRSHDRPRVPLLPVLAIFLRIPPGELFAQLGSDVAIDALIVTAKTTAIAQAVILRSARLLRTCSRRDAFAAGRS